VQVMVHTCMHRPRDEESRPKRVHTKLCNYLRKTCATCPATSSTGPGPYKKLLDVKKKRRFKAAMSARCLHPGRATFKTYDVRQVTRVLAEPESFRLGSLTR